MGFLFLKKYIEIYLYSSFIYKYSENLSVICGLYLLVIGLKFCNYVVFLSSHVKKTLYLISLCTLMFLK